MRSGSADYDRADPASDLRRRPATRSGDKELQAVPAGRCLRQV
jgi:hypothetical protein